MSETEWLPYATLAFTVVSTAVAGSFTALKWLDQRRQELLAKRFEQYWQLINTTQESVHVAKQRIALLQLARFPEFAAETRAFLADSETKNSTWGLQNGPAIEAVLKRLDVTGAD